MSNSLPAIGKTCAIKQSHENLVQNNSMTYVKEHRQVFDDSCILCCKERQEEILGPFSQQCNEQINWFELYVKGLHEDPWDQRLMDGDHCGN